jgi:sarcosine oxidase subunit beta
MAQTLTADVAIIGGGIHGCSAALHLRKRGASVVLLESGLCGAQASGVNFGGVRQQGRAFEELPLARRSRALWGRIRELIDHDGEFVASGHLRLACSEAEMAALEAWAKGARDYGLHSELLGRNAIRDRYPWVGERVIGGSLLAEDGQANPRLVSPLFAKAARKAGADIRENTKVTGAMRDGEGFVVEAETGLKVRSRILVNAAGAWACDVAAWFGEIVAEEARSPNMNVTEPLPFFLNANAALMGEGDGVYMRQVERGNVVYGGAGRGVPDRIARRTRPVAAVSARAGHAIAMSVPALRHARVIRSWGGIEGYMKDEVPVLGPSRTTPGLIHSFGYSGHGFQLGPGCGAIVAELALDGRTDTPIARFAIDRFA